jgi:nucleoid DNA-binding protein
MHMAKSMTKSAIIAHLAQKTELSKKQITDVMDQLLSLAQKEAKNVFVVPNFGATRRPESPSRFPPSAW